ncbi:MAG: hypothetical protein KJ875_17755 [Alphaproteobacteria bacterium]|nr:hypothetical protein [Alphaproteobacteria bacterium]MBU1573021.1 hypothetical protein [Alphaproteobacteria bacterium]MBU2079980.1 hypothetical protein [Alphaproteobacteria bacterium]MBU2162754.1 hypothetical protein [Alphaproteobacteria bacterium]MBU2244170.1 hypothetical protein [Alphaproteobacteria bacterium]
MAIKNDKSELFISNFEYGALTRLPSTSATPKSSKTTANVTVNVAGTPGKKACWLVDHTITVSSELLGHVCQSILMMKSLLPPQPDADPYFELEDAAARSLPKQLRQIADLLDEQIRQTDKTADAATGKDGDST